MHKKRLFLHVSITLLLVVLVFGKLIPNLNQIYFSKDGDGFRTYFGMYYHAKYDSTASRLNGMNYPYGEIINFTDCQPPVSNLIQFVSNNLFDITAYTTGINNGLMLFSIVLAAIFLFLIFRLLEMPFLYASAVSLCMVFLSPQIQRMGGHFSLSWMFWVPLSIYFLLLFDRKNSWLISILIFVSAYLSGAMHFYFLAFWVFLFAPYWLYRWFLSARYKFQKTDLFHFFVQVLLPVAVLQAGLIMHDSVIDRTSNPWGFYDFRGHFISVFLPLFKSYLPVFNNWGFAKRVPWEAFSYIGLVASVGFFVMIGRWGIKWLKTKKIHSIAGNSLLDFLFVVSFLVLLFSFGIPFVLGLDKLRNFIGPLGQLRGVARFAWLFYYVINILVFRCIYIELWKGNKVWWKKTLVIVLVAFFAFEAWSYSGSYQNKMNNSLDDMDGSNPVSLVSLVNKTVLPSQFQAVLPLPYFNVGSESIWEHAECNIMNQTFIVSMESGIPNIGVMAARTSISEAYKNIALVRTPWDEYEVLNDYPNHKPILLTVAKCDQINDDEKRLISHAQWIAGTPYIDLYSLDFDTLRSLPVLHDFPSRYQSVLDSIAIIMPDTLAFIDQNGSIYDNSKLFSYKVSHRFTRFIEAPIKLDMEQPVYVRFWVHNYAKDLVARTRLLVIQSTPDHQTLDEKYTDVFHHIRTFQGDWALIEIELQPKQENQIITVLFKNYEYRGKTLCFDEMSISQIGF